VAEKIKKLYKLRVPNEIADLIRNLHPQLKRKVKSALKLIISDPQAGKPLKADLKGLSSFKVGQFRIIYRIASNRVIEIITIGPRKTIYDETYIIIRKEAQDKE
jgi:mRNA interferase RelE/StbE